MHDTLKSLEDMIEEIAAMLPLPNHLLNIDPEEVVHEIEDDPLSQFVWSFRPNLVTFTRKPFASLRAWVSKPQTDTSCTECGAQ